MRAGTTVLAQSPRGAFTVSVQSETSRVDRLRSRSLLPRAAQISRRCTTQQILAWPPLFSGGPDYSGSGRVQLGLWPTQLVTGNAEPALAATIRDEVLPLTLSHTS